MASKRTYRDGCSSALALDIVGERWALLIVRDLLLGPKRFTDLSAGLPQGSPNVLTQRLRELEESGVVRRRRLPPPASTTVYELTEWGAELEPIVLGLQRWGASAATFPGEVPVGCDAAMLALKNAFEPGAAAGLRTEIEVRFDLGSFRVVVEDGTISIHRGAAERPVAVISTDPPTLEAVAFGATTLGAAERSGALEIDGDRAVVERLLQTFAPVRRGELEGTDRA